MRALPVLPLIAALAACSPGDQHKTTDHIKATASDLHHTVIDGTNSPAGAALKADAKDLAKDTGKAIKAGAVQTKHALDNTLDKQKR